MKKNSTELGVYFLIGRRYLRFFLFVLAFSIWPCLAEAEQPRLVLVTPNPGDEGLETLRDELTALGFLVSIAQVQEIPNRTHLERVGRTEAAIAVIRVVPTGGGFEVWITDRVTNKTVLREILLPPSQNDREGIVAVRTAELLRASLMEVHAIHEVHGEIAVTEAIQVFAEPAHPPDAAEASEEMARRRVALLFASAVSYSVGGMGVAPHALIEASYSPSQRLSLGLSALLPLYPFRIEEQEGWADAFVPLIGGAVNVELGRLGSRVHPSLGGGIGALIVAVEGHADPPYQGQQAPVTATAFWLRFGLDIDIADHIYVTTGITCSLATPRPVIRFVDRDVASLGRPLMYYWIGVKFDIVRQRVESEPE